MLDEEVALTNHVFSAMKHFELDEEGMDEEIQAIFINTLSCLTASPSLWKCYKEYLEVLEPSIWFSDNSRLPKQNIEKMGELFKLYLTLCKVPTHAFSAQDWMGFALWSIVLKSDVVMHQEVSHTIEKIRACNVM